MRRKNPHGHAKVKLPAELRCITVSRAMGPARNVGATECQAHRTSALTIATEVPRNNESAQH